MSFHVFSHVSILGKLLSTHFTLQGPYSLMNCHDVILQLSTIVEISLTVWTRIWSNFFVNVFHVAFKRLWIFELHSAKITNVLPWVFMFAFDMSNHVTPVSLKIKDLSKHLTIKTLKEKLLTNFLPQNSQVYSSLWSFSWNFLMWRRRPKFLVNVFPQ